MLRADFDLGATALAGAPVGALDRAQRVMEGHIGLLRAPGVVGMWVGARAFKPYIMLALDEAHSEQLRCAIPDALDGVSVYYVEGTPDLG